MNQATAQQTASVGDALNNARQLLLSHPKAAARQAMAIIGAEPSIAEAHFIFASALRQLGQYAEADAAEQNGLAVSSRDPILLSAARSIASGHFHEAGALLERYLGDTPNDPGALRLLAIIEMEREELGRAEQLLWRALGTAPSFETAKTDFIGLQGLQAHAFARDGSKPADPPVGIEEFRETIKLNERAIENHPDKPAVWLSYGHALRLAGRHDECVAAYRRAIELMPGYGEAWWSLADLKTSIIGSDDQARMQAALASNISDHHRTGIHFALGKALSDEGRHAEAFEQYRVGNALKRKTVAYDVADTLDHVRKCKQHFDAGFFETRRGQGFDARDPVFIVGMPRSGSTLVEQILASHPSIEGTEELVYFGNLASFIAGGRKAGIHASNFVEAVASLPAERLHATGGAYLFNAERNRRSRRPYFTDKMPRNWLYLPLIMATLPQAKIIDVRRNALDCCWSNYRQLFADSGEYSYDLSELGRYYGAYVDMVDHFAAMRPGAVYRLNYESLVSDPEAEVRKLLDHIGLAFDPACLAFDRNPRAVKTASSEQVRQPINRGGLDQWQPYQQWLGPLKEALGPSLAQ